MLTDFEHPPVEVFVESEVAEPEVAELEVVLEAELADVGVEPPPEPPPQPTRKSVKTVSLDNM